MNLLAEPAGTVQRPLQLKVADCSGSNRDAHCRRHRSLNQSFNQGLVPGVSANWQSRPLPAAGDRPLRRSHTHRLSSFQKV